MEEPKRVLFVNSEIFPFLPETYISTVGRFLPQGIQERGKEIRSFMPRYGCINERRNQLHEVIRLSGMNIVVNKIDRPLVIKVSSISSARMQVYFIDNDDYFHRKQLSADLEGNYFEDNDERALFFARGVLETVKKLRWKPDIIHCQGWITHYLPMYLKNVYKDDPIFSDTKLVLSLYGDCIDMKLDPGVAAKISSGSSRKDDAPLIKAADGINLAKLAIRYSDGIIYGTDSPDPELESEVAKSGKPTLGYMAASQTDNAYINEYNNFYDRLLEL